MLTVDEALRLVLEHAEPLPPRRVELPEALGCVLAQSVTSDSDSPPHDKALVDGYAVVASSLREPGDVVTILEEVTAGGLPTRTVEPGTGTRIMTGAPLPPGADAVVMIERTAAGPSGPNSVQILQSPVKSGQYIMRRAASLARGQTVLSSGKRLRAIEVGLLAEVGHTAVSVVPQPHVAVLATGNELVETTAAPGPGQIRNSNGPLLAALVRQAGAQPVELGIARDDAADLRGAITRGLAHDMLVVSGGVSAGVLDLVPGVLLELDVQQVFHKVNLKPGKPLWFGVHRHGVGGRQTLVFGLPGNPVSSLVCFELFVRPAIAGLRGLPATGLPRAKARLARSHQQRGDRPTYWPAALNSDQRDLAVAPLPWQGSGDLRTLTDANALAFFPAGDRLFVAGEEIEIFRLPSED